VEDAVEGRRYVVKKDVVKKVVVKKVVATS
jgi:hypothetical protein